MGLFGFTNEEQATLDCIAGQSRIVAMIPTLDIKALIDRFAWMHGLGCMLDPTAYNQFFTSGGGRELEAIVKAYQEFQAVVQTNAHRLRKDE